MHRLFKEVFKSLARNKITLICLTILIFLTSGIFTLLFDVKKSYSSTINDYDRVSRIHDLTVDLDVNPSGLVPNSGFNQIDLDNKTKRQDGIVFEVADVESKKEFSLNMPDEDQNFIQLKNKFKNLNIDDANLYISTEDFASFYWTSKKPNSSVNFELTKSNPDESRIKEFSLISPWKFTLYTKKNNLFVPLGKKISNQIGDTFNWTNKIYLKDLGEIVHSPIGPNGKNEIPEYIINPTSLFINVETRQVSLLSSDYQEWKNQGTLFVISGEELMKNLGFELKNGNQWYFNNALYENADIKFEDEFKTTNNTLFDLDALKNEFVLNNFLKTNKIEAEIKQEITLKPNIVYELPQSYIRTKSESSSYVWNRYTLNWNEIEDEENSNWKGSFLKYIKLLKANDPTKYHDLKYFSYWTKNKIITYQIGSNKQKSYNEVIPITINDLDVTFKNPWDGGEFNIYNPNELNSTENRKSYYTIRQIEFPNTIAYEPIDDVEIAKISKSTKLNENSELIRSGANNLARLAIIDELKKQVGEENLGLRESITVETVDEITTKKNVFHFINTGDKDFKIQGLTQNIGKLYNEQYNPTILNSSITNKNTDDFILKPKPGDKTFRKIPSDYATTIIEMVSKQYTPDPYYFKTNIIFDTYYDYYPNTQIPRANPNSKIIMLTIADDEPYSEKGHTIIAGVIYKNGKYSIVVKDTIDGFQQEKVWKTVIFNNKENFTLDELHKILKEQNWTIDGIIGKNGWLAVNSTYRNSMSLPIAFGAINSEFAVEIINKKTTDLLIGAIKKILSETDLKKIIRRDDLNKIFDAVQQAIEQNNLHILLSVAKVNNEIVIKTIFDVIKILNQSVSKTAPNSSHANMNGNAFLKGILNYAIDYFKEQYMLSGSTEIERNAYFEKQIETIAPILGLGSKIVVPYLNMSIKDLLIYVKNKEAVFDILKQIIDAFDFAKLSKIIDEWYNLPNHNLKQYSTTDDEYWSLSKDRIIISVLKSLDEYKIKTALKGLVNQIDFNRLLNPNSNDSYYAKLIKAKEANNEILSEEEKNKIKNLFIKFNGYKDPAKAYLNINEGIGEIIDLFSLEKFNNSLDILIRHIKSSIIANKKIYDNWNTEVLDTVDYLSAFISGLNSSVDPKVTGKIGKLQNSIIKLFNLSSKTKNLVDKLNIIIPAEDEEKLSALDLFVIPALAMPNPNNHIATPDETNPSFDAFNLNHINNLIAKTNNLKINHQRFQITQNELSFLKNIVLVNDDDLNDLDDVIEKLEKYKALVEKLSLSNYGPLKEKGNWNYDFKDDINKEIKTFGDLAYRSALINPNDPKHEEDGKILTTLHAFLAQKLFGNMLGSSQAEFINKELNLNSLWIKIAYELRDLSNDTVKTKLDPETGLTVSEIIKDNLLSLVQVKEIMMDIFNIANSPEIKALMNAYNDVKYALPSMGILGSDNIYKSKLFKLSRAHVEPNLAIKTLKDQIENATVFQTLFNKVKEMSNNPDIANKVKNILLRHINELTYNFGYISAADQMPTFYLASLKQFLNSFIGDDNSLIPSDYEFDVIYKLVLEYSKLSNGLAIINVPRPILNPLLALNFPQILLYYVLTNNEQDGNLAFIVKKIMKNLEGISLTEIKDSLITLFDSFKTRKWIVPSKDNENVNLDLSSFAYTFDQGLKTADGKDIEFFGINITKTANDSIYKIIQPMTIWNTIVYSDSGSYLAKVNYGYFNKNKKEIYTGDLTEALKNPIEMERLIKSLPAKNKITVNTIEYIIIGVDTTADYLYPVINEENLQVDTKSQALVYVNQKGFDRMYSAYPTFAIKKSVLVAAPKDAKGKYLANKSPEELQIELQKVVDQYSTNGMKKVYLADETDFLNPERAIRYKTVRSIVKVIEQTSIYSVILLIVLVAFIVYFIIKRYIEARNKVIGILRAQGYTTGEIAFSFCAFGWIPSGIGGLAGYITGLLLQLKTMQIFSSYWTLENNTIPFNWLSMFITTILPIIASSILIFIITKVSVKTKPTEMMSGLVDLNIGNVASKVSSIFRRFGIKMKFIASMALNNFWKMLSLFLAFSTTSLISMFFLSSNNVFDRSISQTYKNRLYKFKLDLETPTTEGGPYVTYNKNIVENLLYMPNDLSGSTSSNGTQLDYDNPNFLRPGFSLNTDTIIRKFDPVVITKSSLDLLMDLNVELSPWDITYASMPETQRARVVQIFNRVSKEIEESQNLVKIPNDAGWYEVICVADINKYYADQKAGLPEDMSNRRSYFTFRGIENYDSDKSSNPNDMQFKFVEWDPVNETYLKPIKISTARHRQEYRDFLINAYKKIDSIDFFVGFAGVYWNENTNEKYSYAKTQIKGKEYRIYGYANDSKYVQIYDEKNNNLSELLNNYQWDPQDAIPVVLNKVTSKNLKIKVGETFEAKVLNHIDRYNYRVLNLEAPRTDYSFKVVGISSTYINNEFVTRKDIIDKILGLDNLTKRLKDARQYELNNLIAKNPQLKEEYIKIFNKKYEAFNGILSVDKTPVQTIDTLTTYSSSGFWGAASTYDVANSSDESIWAFFKRIFISDPSVNFVSVFEHLVNSVNESRETNYSYKDKLYEFTKLSEYDYNYILEHKRDTLYNYVKLARDALNRMYGTDTNAIYGKDIMFGASFDVNSKDIEIGFITGISETINTVLVAFIVVSFIISIVILIVITNIMISSNQRAIATFSVLGYSNFEKIFLFFFNFVPVILFACALMIPVTFGLIFLFNQFMMATSQIVLPLTLNISTIILSATMCISVFTITSMITWNSLNKTKAIDALKGK